MTVEESPPTGPVAGWRPMKPVIAADQAPWLMIVDLQRVFSQSASPWFVPGFSRVTAAATRLRAGFGTRVALTRFVPPEEPLGAWVRYYEQSAFAVDPANLALFDLVPEVPVDRATVLDCTTFGKWTAATRDALQGVATIVLAGVATDCCVLSTALAAADAGVFVQVVADACATVTDLDHRRALDVMSLYAPMIEITSVDDVLAGLRA